MKHRNSNLDITLNEVEYVPEPWENIFPVRKRINQQADLTRQHEVLFSQKKTTPTVCEEIFRRN
jgi:hypothetical protein